MVQSSEMLWRQVRGRFGKEGGGFREWDEVHTWPWIELVVHAEQGVQEIRYPQNWALSLAWIVVHIIMQFYYPDDMLFRYFFMSNGDKSALISIRTTKLSLIPYYCAAKSQI